MAIVGRENQKMTTTARAIVTVATGILTASLTSTAPATTSCSHGGPLPDHVVDHLRRSQVSVHTPGAWRGKALEAKLARKGLREGPRGVSGVLQVPVIVNGFANVNIPANTVANLQTELFDGPWATGTLAEYWTEVSYGAFTFDGQVVNGGNLPSNDTAYEGATNGLSGPLMKAYVNDAVTSVDATIDFSIYDNDGPDGVPNSGDDDGVVDLLALVHPEFGGENNVAGNSNIWSHRWSYTAASGSMLQTNDNAAGGGKIMIDDYTIMPARNSAGNLIEMGVFAHEFGHALGLPDLYDRDDSNSGTGWHCLMGTGNWNTPTSPSHLSVWCRAELGWVEPQLMIGDYDDEPLRAIETQPAAYKIVHDPAGVEYFLVENRQPIGFDQSLTGCGLLIWHVDPSVGTAWNDDQFCTGGATNSYLVPEQADGRCDLENKTNRGDAGDFWNLNPAASIFSIDSAPNSRPDSQAAFGPTLDDFRACGDPILFDASVDPLPIAEARPLDVVFIFDTSASYSDDLPIMLGQMPSVIDDIQAKFPNPRFGIGSFRDFPFSPVGDGSDWAWKRNLDLTSSEPSVLGSLSSLVAGGGNDLPESQYEAVFQAMTGAGRDLDGDQAYTSLGEIPPQPFTWDNTRAPVIFVMTDASFHDSDVEDYPPGQGQAAGRLQVLGELAAPTVLHEAPRVFTLNAAWNGPTLSGGSSEGSPWDPGTLYEQGSEMGLYCGGSIIEAGPNSINFRIAVQQALNLLGTQMPAIGTCCLATGDCIGGVTDVDCETLIGGTFAAGGHVCESDCNGNGKPDGCEIALGTVDDANGNGTPDDCECIGDSNTDGFVNIDDLLYLLAYWGDCTNCEHVDHDGDGDVDIDDMLTTLGSWGECPNSGGCGDLEILDCFGSCAPRVWLGDGTCDDGSYDYNGIPIYFNCEQYAWDEGDCEACASGEIADCRGNCCPGTWVGDGYCDDGSYVWNGVQIYLNCDRYHNDGGDCDP